MAFSSSITNTIPGGEGSKALVYGTFTNDGGSTGGDVTTRLNTVEAFFIQNGGSAIVASTPVVNETFPLINSTGAVTIVTNANDTGYWMAIGY